MSMIDGGPSSVAKMLRP